MRSNHVMARIAALLLAGASASAVHAANGDSWDWSIAPYIWGPSIKTDVHVDVPPIDTDGTNEFSDVIDKLNGALLLHLEGQGDDYGILSDIIYLSLSQTRHREFLSIDTSQDIGMFELAGVWSPGDTRHSGFEAFAGLRYLWGKVELKIDPENPALNNAEVSVDKSFADFMVGARYTAELSERWALTLRGDGSFGSTDGTYGASGVFQYRTSNGAWLFGYRYMKLKFGEHDRSIDVKLYGPEVGYAFTF